MTLVSESQPARQGYFKVTLKDGSTTIAQYAKVTPANKDKPYIWQSFKSDSPFEEKEAYELEGEHEVVSYDKIAQSEVDEFLKRKLTLDEKIEHAFKTNVRTYHRSGPASDYAMDVPANRRLAIGEKVRIGNLNNCVVVGLREDDQVVIAKHTVSKSPRNSVQTFEEFDEGTTLWVGDWTSVLKDSDVEAADSKLASDFEIFGSSRTSDLSGLLHSCLHSGLSLNPDYQRGYVWTDTDRENLIASVFDSRNIGSFILYRKPSPDYRLEAIDGKQRLTTLIDFYTSKFAYKGVYYHQLSFKDRMHFERFECTWTESNRPVTRKYLLQVFLHVNTTGVPQEAGHLDKVKALLDAEPM